MNSQHETYNFTTIVECVHSFVMVDTVWIVNCCMCLKVFATHKPLYHHCESTSLTRSCTVFVSKHSIREHTAIQCGRVAGELTTQTCDKIAWLYMRRMYLTSHRLPSVILHERVLHWQCLFWFAPYPQRSGNCCVISCYQSQGSGYEIIGRRNDLYLCMCNTIFLSYQPIKTLGKDISENMYIVARHNLHITFNTTGVN